MRIPADLTPVIGPVGGVLAAPGVLGGYLHGSWALGCADEESDVDVLVVTDGPAGPELLAGLAGLAVAGHRLDVSLAPLADLRSPMRIGAAWPRLAPGTTAVSRSAHDNTAAARWLVRERGVAITGPPAPELVGEVTAAALRADTVGRTRGLAEAFETDPASYDDAWAQPRLVLECCRSLVTAARAEVLGRVEAAAWVRTEVPALIGYDDLLAAAVADLPGRLGRIGTPADPERLRRTRSLLWDTARVSGTLALDAR